MEEIIKVTNLSKTYKTKNKEVNALSNVNLSIERGDIFGIIGLSGAGKSTLVRCLNYLEKPTSGEVYVNGVELSTLKNKDLRKLRLKIGMIFQNFNLLEQKTALKNVMFALDVGHFKGTKNEKIKRAEELLDLVGLNDKYNSYPSELSGGQRQRVAIARALANNPDILLCDEATSALDPNTTHQILELLKKLNENLGITVVIITHQMSVVEEICNKVAIIDEASIKEVGYVKDIFIAPKTKIAQDLIFSNSDLVDKAYGNKLIKLYFDGNTFNHVVADLILTTKVKISIIYANIKSENDITKGELIFQLTDNETDYAKVINYLNSIQIKYDIEELEGEKNDK